MRGITAKKTKPAKLRRPQGMDTSGVRGATTSNNLPSTGQNGNTDGAPYLPSVLADDPLAALYPSGQGKTYYRTEQGQIDIMDDVNASLIEPWAADPQLREKLRAQLIAQAGGHPEHDAEPDSAHGKHRAAPHYEIEDYPGTGKARLHPGQ